MLVTFQESIMILDMREYMAIVVKYVVYIVFSLVSISLPIIFILGVYTLVFDEISWFPQLLKVFVVSVPIIFVLIYLHNRLDTYE